VGTKTGRTEDKAAAVHWEVKQASKVNALYSPVFGLVYQSKLVDFKKLGLHTIYFGEVVEVDVRDDCASEGSVPSIARLEPVLFHLVDVGYFKVGERVATATELYKTLEAK
jgi:flavin reductase (DIM6/NTAB) family NADH-FMN oxidoreductase RutF